jgi:hypothetical protein
VLRHSRGQEGHKCDHDRLRDTIKQDRRRHSRKPLIASLEMKSASTAMECG